MTLTARLCLIAAAWCALAALPALAQEVRSPNAEPVELNGDSIEYKAEEGMFVATGNVYLKQNNAVLFCDRLEFYRDKKEAHAEGNVVLESEKGKVWAEKAFYNFETRKGEFTNARLIADPIYGRARSIVKVAEDHYVVSNGYLTTSDYDDPGYRIKARTIDVYPGDKAVARHAVMQLGGVPSLYLPTYTQDLSGKRPVIKVIPGYRKHYGPFVLTSYRMSWNDKIETTYHLDYRELKGLAWGVDTSYRSDQAGQGLVRVYYMNERDSEVTPSTEKQRYRVEWRHKWDLDPSTTILSQYYKQTDDRFLKDYFPSEYHQDQNPPSYVLMTHTTPQTSSYIRVDKRVNRFESPVERLPEAGFSLSSTQIGDTGFYIKSTSTASNLTQKQPSPADYNNTTQRLDTNNELSRPFKVAFLEFRPFVSNEETYYSRTLDPQKENVVRGVFRTGTDVSTKFYRIYDVDYHQYGIDINNLRHVVSPTMTYTYQHRPTLGSDILYRFDSIDTVDRIDDFSLGLENKLQTKRDGKSVDLLRALLTTDFRLKDNPSSGSFGDVTLKTDLTPNKYWSLYTDSTYDNDHQKLKTMNFDAYYDSHRDWRVDLGHRYAFGEDDLVTGGWEYKINPIWRVALYDRWNTRRGYLEDQQYSFIRDLHSWEMEFACRHQSRIENGGTEYWVIFRLKAFPSVSTGSGTSFKYTHPGTQMGY